MVIKSTCDRWCFLARPYDRLAGSGVRRDPTPRLPRRVADRSWSAPQKATVALQSPSSGWIYIYRILLSQFDGTENVALNNSLEVLGHRGMMRMPEHFPGSARIIPDWAAANSRSIRNGIWSQGVDSVNVFLERTRDSGEKTDEIRFRREEPGNSPNLPPVDLHTSGSRAKRAFFLNVLEAQLGPPAHQVSTSFCVRANSSAGSSIAAGSALGGNVTVTPCDAPDPSSSLRCVRASRRVPEGG